jgi:hypothetical protein
MRGRWLGLGVLAVASAAVAGPVRFEAGPGCAEAAAFDGLVPQADWGLSVGPEAGGWRLELSRGGRRALVRALPAASSCAALRQAAQLIIERYFREVAAGRASAPPPAATAEPAPRTAEGRSTQSGSPREPSPPASRANAVATEREAPHAAASDPRPEETASPGDARATVPDERPAVAASDARSAETAPPRGPSAASPATSDARSPQTGPPNGPAATGPATTDARPAETGSPRGPSAASTASGAARPATTAPVPDAAPPGTAVAAADSPPAAVETPPPPVVASTAPPVEPRAPLAARLELSAGGGALGAFGQSATDGGAFATAHAALHLGALLRVGLLGGFSTAVTRAATVGTVTRGTAWAVPFVVAAQAGACGPWAVELCGAAVAGIRGARGGASGDRIFQTQDAWLVRPDVGLLARAQWRPWRGFFVALEAWAAFPLGGGEFKVDGIPSASIVLPVVDVTGSLQLGWTWQIL